MNLFTANAMAALLNRTLVGGAAVLVIFVLRFLMKKLPKKYLCLLWLVPFARLLFSFSVPSPFSLLLVAPEPFQVTGQAVGDMGMTGEIPRFVTGISLVDEPVSRFLEENMAPAPEMSADPLQAAAFLFQGLWILGMALFLAGNMFWYVRLKKSLGTAVPAEENQRRAKGELLDGVYLSDRISMPLVLGMGQPKIFLPVFLADESRETEREMILAHEHAHRLRHDPALKLLAFGVLAVHWFNPLVWFAYRAFCRDMEMACDEKAVEWLGSGMEKTYSRTLLQFGEEQSGLFIPLAFGESHTKARIRNILNYKKPGFWAGAVSLLLLTGTAAALLTNPDGDQTEGITVIGGADGPTSVFVAGKTGENEGVSIIGGVDGPTSIFVAGKNGEEGTGTGQPADRLDLEAAKKQPFGMTVELDWVHADKISLHGSFGYLSFELKDQGGSLKAEPAAAFSLKEAGPVVTQGDGYTEVLGGEDSALVVTNAYRDGGDCRFYWYLEESGTVETFPEEIQSVFLENREAGAFKDAQIEEEYMEAFARALSEEPELRLLYGPVEIPETDSIVCGFLAADGENLEDLWYGLWRETDGTIEKIPLFP